MSRRKPRLTLRKLGLGALPTLAILALWLLAGGAPPLSIAELATLDARFGLRGPVPPGPDVALVLIDDRTVDAVGTWPLPRATLAEAVSELDRLGAAVIAFDLLLPDRPGIAADSADGAGDVALAEAITRAPGVIVPFALVWNRAEAGVTDLPDSVARSAYRIVIGEVETTALAPPAVGAVVPAPPLAEAATTTAHVSVLLADDGSLRTDRLALGDGRQLYPSLTVEAVRLFDGTRRDRVAVEAGRGIGIGQRFVATGPNLALPVNHYGPRATFPAWSMTDLLSGRLPEAAVAGRVVVVGASAVGLGDTFATPYSQTLPGAEHFATAIDNILTDRMLDRSTWAQAMDLAGILLVGGISALAWRLAPPIAATLGVAAILAWVAVAQAAFVLGPVWIGVAGPVLAGVANLGTFGLASAITERRRAEATERRRAALARYLPEPLAARLAEMPGPVPPRATTATVLFVDLAGFTTLAERLPAAEAMAVLRAFHARVETAVLSRGGMVDKYIGDGALAAFGAMDPVPTAAADALACARDLIDAMRRWSAERMAQGEAGLGIGIGIHTGSLLVGDVGGPQQPQFTVVGDTVNVASRLQGLCGSLDAGIVASDATIDAARATGGEAAIAGFVRHGPRELRGRKTPVGIWVVSAVGD